MTLALMAATILANAQKPEKNIFGIRAGMTVCDSKIKVGASTVSSSARPGFHIAGEYQRLLTESFPIYLETGIGISENSTSFNLSGTRTRLGIWYLQIPVMVNYKIFAGDFTLYPSIGIVCSAGVSGSAVSEYQLPDLETGESATFRERKRVFGKYDSNTGEGGVCRRPDVGAKVSFNAEWRKFHLDLSFASGFLNIANTGESGIFYSDTSMRNNCCFSISLGYNF